MNVAKVFNKFGFNVPLSLCERNVSRAVFSHSVVVTLEWLIFAPPYSAMVDSNSGLFELFQ